MRFTKTYFTDIEIIGHRCLMEPIGEATPDGAMIIDLLVDEKHKISVAAFDVTDLSTYTNIYDEEMLDIDIEAYSDVFKSNDDFFSKIYNMVVSYCDTKNLPKGYMDPSADSYMVNQIKENLLEGKTEGVLYEDDIFFSTTYKMTDKSIVFNNTFISLTTTVDPLVPLDTYVAVFAKKFNSVIDGKYKKIISERLFWKSFLY